MPVLDWDPGASPEAPGTLYFYEQGQDPSTGLQVTSKGEILAPNGSGLTFPAVEFQPADHGLLGWAFDPALAASGGLATNGTQYLTKIPVRKTMSVSSVWWAVTTAGATATAGQNWVGLYDPSGNRLAQVGVDSAVASTGPKQSTFTAVTVSAPFVWVAFVFNAATGPTLARSSSFETTPNTGLTGTPASLRFAVNGTGKTTLPATITPGSNSTSNSLNLWAGLS